MKREIKFRVFDSLLKQMIPDVHGFHFMGEVMAFGIMEQYIFEHLEGVTSLERWGDMEVMQFTGLKDKNGKDIYEGDVVEHGIVGEKSIVKFKNGSFYLEFQSDVCLRHYAMIVCNVIGNIFENPELLNS